MQKNSNAGNYLRIRKNYFLPKTYTYMKLQGGNFTHITVTKKKKIQTLKHTYEIKSILGLRNHSLEPYIT